MSVFSKIVLSRRAAKAHKAKVAEKEVPVKVPYKHVPTHAAIDALSGAPSSWKNEDRPKIREHHKRRSQLAVTSRTPSTVSTTSYLNSAAGPSTGAPPLPRNSSYSSYNPTWFDRSGDVYHSPEPAQKRKRQSRGHSYHDSGIGASIGPSPLASNMHSEDVSPAASSGNSTNSDSSDNLEISVAPNPNHHISARPKSIRTNSRTSHRISRPQPNVYEEKDIFSRLHTSTTRKLGEAPLHDRPPVVVKTANVVVQEQKPKKPKWSLLGKKANANIVA